MEDGEAQGILAFTEFQGTTDTSWASAGAMSSSRQHVHDDQWSGNLETTRADRSLWLMKCPLMVSKTWQEQTRAHTSDSSHLPILAKVVRSIDPLRPQNSSSVEYIMELVGVPGNAINASSAGDAGDEGVNVPKFYEMNMAGDIIPLCVLSESNQGKVAMEGKVEHKFDMKPSNTGDPEYHKICRVRKKKSEVKARQTQLIHNDRGELMRPMPGMVGLVPSNSKDKKKTTPMKGSDMKRTRRDRSELEDIMFKLFERQPNWALKQLVQETDQPAQFLKEILNELCIYNKRGTNQGTYELKPEYRKSNEEADAE